MKRASLARISSKYKWEIAEPYLDVVLDQSSRNRKLDFITLRQFKNNIAAGISSVEMKKSGICKHLLQFFGNFCQDKILLTKERFEELYNQGKSLEEMCEQFSISRGDIAFLRQLYGIRVKGATFQNRKATEVPLTQRQKEIIYGSLMGDAKREHGSSVGFVHGAKQRSYLICMMVDCSFLSR